MGGCVCSTYILILNWNGWKDTIECLESVFRLNYKHYRVIICDNDSSDGSLEHIKAWAEGRLDVYLDATSGLRIHSFPPIPKSIPYRQYKRKEAETGGDADDAGYPLILIRNDANLGFAGGNNPGLRYALARNDFAYIWLLNNDTVVTAETLYNLINKAKYYKSVQCRVGIIGSKLLFYDRPDIIQSVGGVYNKWFAATRQIGLFAKDNGEYDNEEVTNKTDYPVGASLFISKEFLQDVGLMCEDYFLYFEELDWVLRGKRKYWDIGYCWQAKVYHKEGATIGSSSDGATRSEKSDYFGVKNRIVFTKKFYPHCLLSVKLGFIIVLFNRIRRSQFGRLGLLLKAFRGKPA